MAGHESVVVESNSYTISKLVIYREMQNPGPALVVTPLTLMSVHHHACKKRSGNITNKHQEVIDEAKDRIEGATGLRSTNENLLKSSRSLGVSPRLRDHMRCVITGRIKCGAYWSNIPNYEDRAICSACKKARNIDIIESERHMWTECENNGQNLAWDTAKLIWQKTTTRAWPNVMMDLIRGTTALTFEDDSSKDSERLRILIL